MTASNEQGLEIRPVVTAEDHDHFLEVPFRLYGPGDNWVPPLYFERREHLSEKKNPYFRHAKVERWIALRGGKPVGRITAQRCKLFQERFGKDKGQFGFLEAENNDETFDALIMTACLWLAERGVETLSGPFSFSINDETGVLVDGFDTPPSMMMNHALPYYATQLERLGFQKARDLYAYDYALDTELPKSLTAMLDRVRASGDLMLRNIDMSNLDKDVDTIISIFNDAWRDNWGFVPMTFEEIKALSNNLKMLVRSEYGAIAYYKGEPAAMCITLPNINDAIADLNGRLLPFGWAKLLWRLKLLPPRTLRMPLLGVRQKYKSDFVGSALVAAVMENVQSYHKARGTTHCELSWILEDNRPVRKLIDFMGGRHYKTYRVYERSVARAGT